MIFVLTLFAAVAASQGQVLSLSLPVDPALQAADVRWAGRDVPFVRTGEGWMTVIGVDLDAPPGVHEAQIRLRYADGRLELRSEQVLVAARSFPTTALQVEPAYVDLSPENQARAAAESAEIAAIYAVLTPERHWQGAFHSPIPGAAGGRNFGHRRIFNGQARAPHSGADLRASTGTPILAANRGRVVLAKDLFFSGNAVFLDHGLGVYSAYLHLSEIQVAAGEMIERGAVLGLAGATGRVTGPHLHWGVRVLDARVDPFTLLELAAD